MKKIIILCVTILGVLLLISSVLGCQQPSAPSPAPGPPVPRPAPPPPFESSVVPEEAHYLPGKPIEVKLSITNTSSDIIAMSQYPPEIRVTPWQDRDRILASRAGDAQPLEVNPGDMVTVEFTWDQKNAEGEQVPPGWYAVTFTDISITQGDRRITYNPGAAVLVRYPQGAMEKSLDLNQSRTVNGVTVTLERIELTADGASFNAFFVAPGYTPPPTGPGLSPVPPPMNVTARAEYSFDGATRNAGFAGYRTEGDGIGLVWGNVPHRLDPVPSDAKELNFIITKLGDDWEGPWEFKVPLGGDSDDNGTSQNVTVSQLVSQADRYNGKVVTLDAFYFYAVMQIDALADSVRLDTSDEGKVIAVGAQIRVKGDISQELQNQMYTQESPSPTNTEYFGKLRITGKFEIDDIDGEYQIDVTKAEVLEWMPPPPQVGAETPAGNLQIKIENAFLGKLLQGAEVISSKQPDGQPELSGLTDDNGMVTFDDIKQGRYEFTVNLEGYLQMNIRLAVTGGRTTSVAFLMARVGEAPDDILPAPGLGPQYRANILAQGVVNPWPPIESTMVTLGASSDAVQVTYRDYIESEAGQTRNNIFYMYRPGSKPGDTSLDVVLSAIAPPSGVTVIQEGGWSGPGTQTKAFLKIEISPQVESGEHTLNINVEINGRDYGSVPCTIKVLE
jgi:hypothetical protein